MKWEHMGRRDEERSDVRTLRDDEIVCRCMSVTAGEIRQCVRNGAVTLEQVQEKTGAGTACGFCRKKLQRLIDASRLREPGPGDIEFIEKHPHDPDPGKSIDEKCRELPVLETQKTDWVELRSLMKGTVSKGFPDYSLEVHEWIRKFLRSDLADPAYPEHYEAVRDCPLEALSRDGILTLMTWYIKEERKQAGLMARALEDGTLPALSRRLRELSKE